VSIITRHSDNCTVVQENTGRQVEAAVMAFHQGRNLTVVMNKSVKLLMVWNGRMYEGRMAGMDFISHGPVINKTSTGLRG
jgi:hypothetical protein